MKKNIIIHMGYEKTGTSSIQMFLIENASYLEKYGFYYPKSDLHRQMNHQLLGFNLLHEKEQRQYGFSKDENIVDRLHSEVQARKEHCYVVSAELLAGRDLNWSKLEKLLSVFDQFTFVIYLRRQDHWHVSRYNQFVRSELVSYSFNEMNYDRIDYFNFIETLRSNTSKFSARILVRPFERVQLYGGDAVCDFAKAVLGLDISEHPELVIPREQNIGLPGELLEYKRIINSFCIPHVALDVGNQLSAYAETRRAAQTPLSSPREIMSPGQRWRLLTELCLEGNAAIAREYLGRASGRLFEEDVSDPNGKWEPPCLSVGLAEEVSRYILHKKYPGSQAHLVDQILARGRRDAPDTTVRGEIEGMLRAMVTDLFGAIQEGTGLERNRNLHRIPGSRELDHSGTPPAH